MHVHTRLEQRRGNKKTPPVARLRADRGRCVQYVSVSEPDGPLIFSWRLAMDFVCASAK